MNKKLLISVICLSFFFFTFSFVNANALETNTKQKGFGANVTKQLKAGAESAEMGVARENPQVVIAEFIKSLLTVVGTVFLLLVLYSGIMLLTASGEQEKVTKALTTIKMAVIGLFVTLSAYAITTIVSQVMLKSLQDRVHQEAPPTVQCKVNKWKFWQKGSFDCVSR
ncbi:MAG: hypothetical protein CL685_00515 [Candidatus Magasanikbacteria bacterium]|nr:hypothetical protein [Candidatus Magasanikbacteria bacterium]|tara:strand:- start:696 stop:1199 length:504 start_codon:yes stop_codon:yes gene_type:complete